MTKPKPKRRPDEDEDEDQSRRFMDEAARVAADGGLSLTEVEEAFEQAMPLVVPAKRTQQSKSE